MCVCALDLSIAPWYPDGSCVLKWFCIAESCVPAASFAEQGRFSYYKTCPSNVNQP